MPRYGRNLLDLFHKNRNYLSDASILHLGLSLLNTLELIHESGLVYNDLKLDNLVLTNHVKVNDLLRSKEDIFKNNEVVLIDFGFATSYINERTNEHIIKT